MRTPDKTPGKDDEPPPLYVDLDWDKQLYYLADMATKKRVAGPFTTSWAALDHAARMRRQERY